MATIKDIAKLAGVGLGTVSRVLNNTGYVSEETRQKVWSAVDALHFVPNGAARSLVTKRTMTLAVVLHDLTNPFVPGLAQGIGDEAKRHGYTMMVLDTDWHNELHAITTLRQQAVDGCILVSPANATELVDKLQKANIPAVVVDRGEESGLAHITVDHYKGALEAMNWAKQQGHSHIGFLAGPRGLRFSDLRLRAYLDSIGRQDVSLGEVDQQKNLPIAYADFRFDQGRLAAETLLYAHPEITCLFAANDLSALGALQYLAQQKITVPDQLAVIGFDDIFISSLVHPTLTTIRQPFYEIGITAARYLLERIQQPDSPMKPYMFDVTLVVRESC
ncbi:LacI family DNA-binding transcriptional regulator [Ktedonospora formicarum]|uniref:LacI family transcriptional regulator n=1 Tax=Ktedonospora formicarum TaxID=2778364 RepID=A0A8J3IBS4_9CHLR|nr:LacI family DNA-binding transcriptional regulator [Ktedonospora formicarum]GHO51068.1 LacI family transcriptional regulator [Ktedonospora formicarum]